MNVGRWTIDLPTQVLIGMVAGIGAGFFFGESVAGLNLIGDAFLRLIQMPVIPYIVVSLIGSLGRLNYSEARQIFFKGGLVLVIFWAIMVTVLLAIPLGFPAWQSASFFNESLLEDSPGINLIELFIPSNPFESMAETTIPAIVLFSSALGFSLISFEEKAKRSLLEILSTLSDGLMRITALVARLTPIGVFAILASSFGTLPLDAFRRLGVYVVIQAVIAVFLSFWVLPRLISLLTPLSCGSVLRAFKTPLITAFATANLLIVLPLIVERSRDLLDEIDPSGGAQSDDTASALNVLVPLSFVFPSLGKLLSLAFVPFAAWYNGSSLAATEYPVFLITGLASFFGDVVIAMKFLFQLLSIPQTMLQLFVTVDQISAARFGTLLAGMNTIALALLATCLINGWLRVRRRRLVTFCWTSPLFLLILLGMIHGFFTYIIPHTYAKDKVLEELQLLRFPEPRSVRVYDSPPLPLPIPPDGGSRLGLIRQRNVLRACYLRDDYPSAYRNGKGDLVGFDVEMAHLLAQDLGTPLELVPLMNLKESHADELSDRLNQGYCDLAVTTTPITPERTEVMNLSRPLMKFTASFLVKNRDQQKFSRWSDLRKAGSLKIGYQDTNDYYKAKILGLLPEVELLPLRHVDEVLSGTYALDAAVVSAEQGSAWTIRFPQYSVAIPKPILSVPVSYALPHGDETWRDWFNAWMELKKQDGTVQSLFDYWVKGRTKAVEAPRWSVIRNVLHWQN